MGKDIVTRYEMAGNPQDTPILSGQCDIEFVFTNINTKLWRDNRPLIQRRADVFVYSVDKTKAYAGFQLNPKTASKVLGVYLRIYNWKTVYVHIKGTDVEILEETKGWMHCLLLAFESGHPETYCTLEDYDPAIHTDEAMWFAHLMNPEYYRSDNMTLPCRNVRWTPDIAHPALYRQAYQDAATKCGCTKCPLFDMRRFCAGGRVRHIKKKALGRN